MDDAVRITKAAQGQKRGQRIVSRLRGTATAGITTEEIMALTRE